MSEQPGEGEDFDSQLAFARERTELALERNLLAQERTYSAWIRTALAAIAGGFAVAELLTSLDPPWAALLIGATFILTGMAILIMSYPDRMALLQRLDARGTTRAPRWLPAVMVGSLLLVSVFGLVILLLNWLGVL